MTIDMTKLQSLVDQVNLINRHFERCDGVVHGDTNFWNECYHNPDITNDVMYDWIQAIRGLYAIDSNIATRHQMGILDDLEAYLNKNWGKPRCFDKGIGRNRHQPAFRPLMEMKDIINKAMGYEPPKPKAKPVPDNPTPFERLFDIQ
jgi:hypothetical protein